MRHVGHSRISVTDPCGSGDATVACSQRECNAQHIIRSCTSVTLRRRHSSGPCRLRSAQCFFSLCIHSISSAVRSSALEEAALCVCSHPRLMEELERALHTRQARRANTVHMNDLMH